MKTLPTFLALLFASLAAAPPAAVARLARPAVENGAAPLPRLDEPAVPPQRLPVTGAAAPSLVAFDDAMLEFMRKYDIQAGVLAVSKDGRVLLERGYGWADKARTRSTPPDAIMRIASVTKPITRAAVLKLIREGKIAYDTKAFQLLGLDPPGGKAADERIYKITVKNLLEHRGGWDHAQAGDPMFQMKRVREDLKLDRPPAARDVVRWMMGRPLQFEPGEREVYSNFGYCVLGRVIEKASGKTYEQYVTQEILRPAGATTVRMSRDRAADRDGREVWYPVADGDFSVEVMDAHGGLASTAADLCRFMHAYWISGEPREAGQKQNWLFFGSLPGTSAMAMQRPSGVDIAVLLAGPDGKNKERLACLPVLREAMSKTAAETLERPAK